MTTSIPSEIPRATHAYPDSIEINYRYNAPTFAIYATSALGSLPLERAVKMRGGIQGTIVLSNGARGQVRVSRVRPGAPINVFIRFNPLSYLAGYQLSASETSYDGAVNWLPVASFRRQVVIDIAQDLAVLFEGAALSIASAIADTQQPGGMIAFLDAHVRHLEIACHIRQPDPAGVVELMKPVFERLFGNSERRGYPSTHDGIEKHSVMVTGWKKDARFKVYQKTSKQVRMEVQLGPKSFARLKLARKLLDLDFRTFFESAYAKVRPYLVSILTHTRVPAGHPPLHLLTEVVAAARDPGRASEVLSLIIRNSRIERSFDSRIVRRLAARRVLQRTQHGVYMLARPYERAARMLRRATEDFTVRQVRRMQ